MTDAAIVIVELSEFEDENPVDSKLDQFLNSQGNATLTNAVRGLTEAEQNTLIESVSAANLPNDATQEQIWEVIPPEIQQRLQEINEASFRQGLEDLDELIAKARVEVEELEKANVADEEDVLPSLD